jgi:hypothetical protein
VKPKLELLDRVLLERILGEAFALMMDPGVKVGDPEVYDRAGHPAVHYGGDDVHFDPGSSCLNILDADTQRPRLAQSGDLVRLVQLTEMLPQYAAQSTAVVCNDVPSEIGDFYRLFLVLWHSSKPIVTGAFGAPTLQSMVDLRSPTPEVLKHLGRSRGQFLTCALLRR